MRLDYVLYVVGVICFIIAGVFVADAVNLSTTDLDLAATAVFFILGLIFAVGGYASRPKVAATMPPISKPTTVEPSPPPQIPPVEEKAEEAPAVTPPVEEAPPPVEEKVEAAPTVEPTLPPVEEATQPPVPTMEETARVKEARPEEAKPEKKPARRRRKKKAAEP